MQRCAGLLLHPTSLPSRFGVGDLGPAADRFLDWAQAAGQSLWQVLPLGPTFDHGSPYDSPSAFAGNPLLVSPEQLHRDGLLTRGDLAARAKGRGRTSDQVDFAAVGHAHTHTLRRAFAHFERRATADQRASFETFLVAPAQAAWLDDWSLFAALGEAHGGQPWWHWARPLARRHVAALDQARQTLHQKMRFHAFVQHQFQRQWRRLRTAAQDRGIALVGDVPIYVAHNSADVWAHRRLFDVRADGHCHGVAGVPPDDFAADGQRWGNPLYRWQRLRTEGFRWWLDRIVTQWNRADYLRLDHFRGFVGYWNVPSRAETAREGRWVQGPGKALFDALKAHVGDPAGALPLLAEDLGVITPDVHALRRDLGIPGTRVLHFGFDDAASEHAPHHVPRDAVVYTGTHDNDTTVGWFHRLPAETRDRVHRYTGGRARGIHWQVIRTAYTTRAVAAIVPVQDVLGLDHAARMNTPGTTHGNWGWRLRPGQLRAATAGRLRPWVALSDREPSVAGGGPI